MPKTPSTRLLGTFSGGGRGAAVLVGRKGERERLPRRGLRRPLSGERRRLSLRGDLLGGERLLLRSLLSGERRRSGDARRSLMGERSLTGLLAGLADRPLRSSLSKSAIEYKN